MKSDIRSVDVIRQIAARPETVWRVRTDPALEEDRLAGEGGLTCRTGTFDPTEGAGDRPETRFAGTVSLMDRMRNAAEEANR